MITETIAITVNGERHQIATSQSITALLSLLSLPLDRVAVELDRVLIRKRDWHSTTVGEGARLEIVEFVGGG